MPINAVLWSSEASELMKLVDACDPVKEKEKEQNAVYTSRH
jgi:hypothetical protein